MDKNKAMIQPPNGGNTSGGASEDMAGIGDVRHPLHTKSLPRRAANSKVGVRSAGKAENKGPSPSDNDGDEGGY